MKGKRGSEKYYLIISLILGLLILGLSLYFIFHEYFTEDDLDWEACRQSIVMRNALPEKDLIVATASSKDIFPLKCKTQVINVDYFDKEKVEEEFADTLASCWYLTGEGEYKFFASGANYELSSRCLICARIHIDDEIEEDYSGKEEINFREALNKPLGGETYLDYLTKGDNSAFAFQKGWSERFTTLYGGHTTSFKQALWTLGSSVIWDVLDKFGGWAANEGGPGFNYSEKYVPGRGDVFVVIAHPIIGKAIGTETPPFSSPYLIFLQQDDFDELDEKLFDWGGFTHTFYPCEAFETIPA